MAGAGRRVDHFEPRVVHRREGARQWQLDHADVRFGAIDLQHGEAVPHFLALRHHRGPDSGAVGSVGEVQAIHFVRDAEQRYVVHFA